MLPSAMLQFPTYRGSLRALRSKCPNVQANRSGHTEEARSQPGGKTVRQLRPGGREAACEQQMTVGSNQRQSVIGVRRGKAALSSGCKSHPATLQPKQPEQLWR